MAFKKGQSGNPGGRPKAAYDVQALARQHTEAAIRTLVDALADPKTAVSAATALLDRGYGKPIQHTVNENHNTQHDARAQARKRALTILNGESAADDGAGGGVVH